MSTRDAIQINLITGEPKINIDSNGPTGAAFEPIVPKEAFRDDMWGHNNPMGPLTAIPGEGTFEGQSFEAIQAASSAQHVGLDSAWQPGEDINMSAASSNRPYEPSSDYGP